MRKRILSILLCLVMVVGLFPTMAFAADGSGATTGSGTKSDPYCVSTYAEMKRLLQTRASYYIKVVGMDNDSANEGVPIRRLIAGRDFLSANSAIDIPSGAHHHLEIATNVWFIADRKDGNKNIFSRLIDVKSGSSLEITGTGSLRVEVNALTVKNAIIDNCGGELTIDGSVVLNGIQDFTTNVATRPIWIDGGVTNIKGGYIYGHNNMKATSDDVTSAISFGNNLAYGTELNISGGTIKQVNNKTNQGNENSCALYVDNDKAAKAIHLTGGIFEGGMKMETGKPLSGLLDTGYQFYDMSANAVFDGSVSKTQKKLTVTPTGVNPTVINETSLTVKSLNERKTLSDLACSYSPNNKMVLDNFSVYKGQNKTSNEITDKNTPYDPNQSYTVMYVFNTNAGFSFSNNIEENVTVTGGDFWEADTFGGSTNMLRVFVNFPASTIDKVSLTIKPENERTTISDLACSYSPNNKMVLDDFFVYKGQNKTSNEITDKNTPYDPNQSYTVMYVFKVNEGFSFSNNIEENVTVTTGGDFWKADTFGGRTDILRVFVNFPGNTPIDSVTLNVPELKVGDTPGDFTLSGTNTGVSAVTTEWKDIPPTGAEESTSYSAFVRLKAENGYVFDANTNVTLIGDYWGSNTGISSDGKTMTVLVGVRILHKHTFGEWKDFGYSEYHIRECSCRAQEKEPHNWEYVAGDKYKCTVCGHTIDGEKTRITYMYASLRSPIDGESPSSHTLAEWVGISGNHYTVESLVWKNEDGSDVTTFESGKIYTGTVTFKADTGFVFAQDKINADDIFSSNVENVGDYTLNTEATILTATFKLKDENVVRPGLNVKVKLPTLNDKIGQSFPAAELVDTTLPDDVELTTSVYENIFDPPITGSVEPNKTYFYAVMLQLKGGSDITKAYNVSYTVTDGGDAEYHTDNLAGYGVLARYKTPDTSKISSVALTITAPKYGEAPATSATGANNTLYTVGTPEWTPAVTDGKFGAAAYTVSIPVTANSGYNFDANCIYTVNGYLATYASGKVSYTFPALTAPHTHTFGEWTKWDDSEHYQSCACGEMKFEAHTFGNWLPDTTKHYKECSICKGKVEASHVESNMITDTPAGIGTEGTWHTKCDVCGKQMNTGTIPALVKIDVANLTVAKPVKDAAAAVASTADTTYTVAYTAWTAADGATLDIGNKFQPGTAYTVKITLEAKNSNVFTADSTYNKIEGKDAKLVTAVTGYTDSVILTYTFDATEGTYVPTKPAITTVALPDGKVGEAYSQTLAATGTNPIAWSIETGNLPDGLTLVGDTIKGTPSKAGDFKFTVKATNGGGSDTKELTIKIADAEAAKYHNVTLTDAGTGATGAGSHAAGTTVNIYAGTKSGYTFNGWTSDDVTVLSASSKNASFVMPDKDVTVKANWVYTGGGSSGGGYTYYTIKATAGVNGSISPTGNVSVREGRDQTFTITPNKGYAVAKVLIDSKNVGAVKSYTFENVKKNHTIEVVFMKASGNPQTGVFVDVPEGSYYEEAVNWAVEKGITTGTDATHFSPNGICTRAQAVTFLWRAAGSPAAKSAVMPFTDVKAGSYYYDAVLWAVENGITKGTSDTMFSPDATCSRAQIVTFLWRSQKSPAAGTANPFTDVKASAYYADAVLWAVKEDVTKGTTNTTFSPDANCTRAQIVTFIWRALAE